MAIDEQRMVDSLYSNPGGSPAEFKSEINTILESSAFSEIETEARGSGDHTFAGELRDTRKALTEALGELNFSPNSVREFGSLMKLWSDKARSGAVPEGDDAKVAAERMVEALGPRAEELLAGSKEVLQFLVSRAPLLGGLLDHGGLRYSPRLHRLLGEVAIARRKAGKR